jgi:GDP-4-dehydro-6-deoxy-D-mannose reductase
MEVVLITGIHGSGASFLAEYIVENHPEVQVHGIARWHSTSHSNNLAKIKNKITIHECDLNDLSSIIRVLRLVKPTKIFNLAAHANVRVSFDIPIAVLQNNIFSTVNLLEACRLECPNVIFQQCSTSEVCGNPLTYPITEEHPLNPPNYYAISKLTGEKAAITAHQAWGLKTVITRAFCYFNSKRKDLFATSFATQIARIEQGKQVFLRHGNLKSIRTGINVKEMAEAYWIASEKCDYGTPYNIGGSEPISVGGVLRLLALKAKVPIFCYEEPSLLRPTDISRQVPDVSKFYNKTGWKPQINLEESLEWLLN